MVHFLLFSEAGATAAEATHLTEVELPASVNLMKTIPHRSAQSLVSQVFLDPVKLSKLAITDSEVIRG